MHHGWTVRTDEGLVVHVREAVVPSAIGESVALELRESDKCNPTELIEVQKPLVPPHRLTGKQPMPHLPENYRVVFPESSSNCHVSSPAGDAGGEIGNGGDPEPDLDLIFDSDCEGGESRSAGLKRESKGKPETGEGSTGKRKRKRKRLRVLNLLVKGSRLMLVELTPNGVHLELVGGLTNVGWKGCG